MPIILGATVLVLAYFTYKLYRDFGWEVLHLIGADRKLKVSTHHRNIRRVSERLTKIYQLAADVHQISDLRLLSQIRCEQPSSRIPVILERPEASKLSDFLLYIISSSFSLVSPYNT